MLVMRAFPRVVALFAPEFYRLCEKWKFMRAARLSPADFYAAPRPERETITDQSIGSRKAAGGAKNGRKEEFCNKLLALGADGIG
jgi:hypothetical protein